MGKGIKSGDIRGNQGKEDNTLSSGLSAFIVVESYKDNQICYRPINYYKLLFFKHTILNEKRVVLPLAG